MIKGKPGWRESKLSDEFASEIFNNKASIPGVTTPAQTESGSITIFYPSSTDDDAITSIPPIVNGGVNKSRLGQGKDVPDEFAGNEVEATIDSINQKYKNSGLHTAKCSSADTGDYSVVKTSDSAQSGILRRPRKKNLLRINVENQAYLFSLENNIAKDIRGNHLAKKETAKLVIKIALALSSIKIDEYDGNLEKETTFLIDVENIRKVLKGPIFEEDGNDHLTMIDKRYYLLGLLEKADSDTLRLNIRRQLYAQAILETIDQEVSASSARQKRILLCVTSKAVRFAHYSIYSQDKLDTFIKQFRQILQTLKKPIKLKDRTIHDYGEKLNFLYSKSPNDIMRVILSAALA